MNQCLICGKPVGKKNGIQCKNKCKHFVHFMCLGCDDETINEIKIGMLAVLCACKKCPFGKEVQADLDDDEETDDDDREFGNSDDEDDDDNDNDGENVAEYCEDLSVVKLEKLSITCPSTCPAKLDIKEGKRNKDKPKNKATKKDSCCPCPDKPEKGQEAVAEEKHAVKKKKQLKQTSVSKSSKELEKQNMIAKYEDKDDDSHKKCCEDLTGDLKLSDKHSRDKEMASSRSDFSQTKASRKKTKGKKAEARVPSGKNFSKMVDASECYPEVKATESPMFVRSKPTDQSLIDVLESVCHTVKQLHNQIRQLLCKVAIKEQAPDI